MAILIVASVLSFMLPASAQNEDVTVTIDDCNAPVGGFATTPVMINDVSTLGVADINLTFNPSVVSIESIEIGPDFNTGDSDIHNEAGYATLGGVSFETDGLTGDIKLADVTLSAVGDPGESSWLNITIVELKEAGAEETPIPATPINGTFIIQDEVPPVVTDPTANPSIISDESVIYGSTESQLSVTVTDASPISSVTIDLTAIGGSSEEPMANIPGTDTYATTTTASVTGVHSLPVNAADEWDNSNTSVSIELTVVSPAVVTIEDDINVAPPPGGMVIAPIMINGISENAKAAAVDINLTYDPEVVIVNTVDDSDFDFLDGAVDNVTGVVRIGAMQMGHAPLSGDIQLCNVTFEGVGPVESMSTLNLSITELLTEGPPPVEIPANVDNGSIKVGELNPPIIEFPLANPDAIPDDTDGEPLWGEMTELSATITDDSGVDYATIDLSPIGGSATTPMTGSGDIFTVETNASVGTAGTHELCINATDIYGNYNDTVCITLIVINNGDVSENDVVSMYDAMFIAKWYYNKPGFDYINERVGDVSGNGATTLFDAMYLAKWYYNKPGFDVLK